jgi:hypothetical protein
MSGTSRKKEQIFLRQVGRSQQTMSNDARCTCKQIDAADFHSSLRARHIRNEMILHPAGLKSAALAAAVSPRKVPCSGSRIRSELGRGKHPHPFLALSRCWPPSMVVQGLAALTADSWQRHERGGSHATLRRPQLATHPQLGADARRFRCQVWFQP